MSTSVNVLIRCDRCLRTQKFTVDTTVPRAQDQVQVARRTALSGGWRSEWDGHRMTDLCPDEK